MYEKDQGAVAEALGLGKGFSFSVACWPVYQMLCGMALELLIKATIVAQQKEPKHTHELLDLADQAGLPTRTEDHDVLRLLSGSIIWEGRYPVPKQEKHFSSQAELQIKVLFDEASIGSLKMLRGNDALSWEHFCSLWGWAYEGYAATAS